MSERGKQNGTGIIYGPPCRAVPGDAIAMKAAGWKPAEADDVDARLLGLVPSVEFFGRDGRLAWHIHSGGRK